MPSKIPSLFRSWGPVTAAHSYLAEAQYPAMFTALLDRVNRGDKPAPQKVLALCQGFEAAYSKGCRIQPD